MPQGLFYCAEINVTSSSLWCSLLVAKDLICLMFRSFAALFLSRGQLCGFGDGDVIQSVGPPASSRLKYLNYNYGHLWFPEDKISVIPFHLPRLQATLCLVLICQI